MEKESANDVIGGADDAFGFPILGRGVWTGKTKLNAVLQKESARGTVKKFGAIVALKTLDFGGKLSGNVCMKVTKGGEGVGLKFEWKSPEIMSKIIQAYKIVLKTRYARNR